MSEVKAVAQTTEAKEVYVLHGIFSCHLCLLTLHTEIVGNLYAWTTDTVKSPVKELLCKDTWLPV
jgi:hypothetical protein